MSETGLLIIGAHGYGRMVVDIASQMGKWNKIAFLDDRDDFDCIYGYPILGKPKYYEVFLNMYKAAFAAYQNNKRRQEWIDKLFDAGFELPEIISPLSFISLKAKIGEGCIIMPTAVINAGAALGNGCIANSGCTVGYDCLIGECVHISPGVNIGNNVKIGSRSWLCIGSSVADNVNIGSDCIIAAGAAVTTDIPDGMMAVGVPAEIKVPEV